MIRKGSDRKIEVAEHKFGADGFITVRNLINGNEELNGKGRVFAHTTVLPAAALGFIFTTGIRKSIMYTAAPPSTTTMAPLCRFLPVM